MDVLQADTRDEACWNSFTIYKVQVMNFPLYLLVFVSVFEIATVSLAHEDCC